MTAPDPALANELDRLTTQVNPENILAVHKVFRERADAMEAQLRSLALDTRIGLCGLDPISKDAAAAFGAKVDALLGAHWAHQKELVVAAEHLKQIARRYGNTEAEIENSLQASP